MKVPKYLFVIVLSILFWSHAAIAGGAAPFTKEVGARIFKTFIETEKEMKKDINKEKRAYYDSNPSEACRVQINWYREVYRKVGYDYDATIVEVAKRLRYSNDPSNEINNKDLSNTAFQNILESLLVVTVYDPENYSRNFVGEARESVIYLYDTVLKRVRY